jgi:hypothetical protein
MLSKPEVIRMRLKAYHLLFLLVACITLARAQPLNSTIPCIDTLAINAESVFVAKVTGIHELDGARTNVNVSVELWLKGDGQSDEFQTRIDDVIVEASNPIVQEFKNKGTRLLMFDGVPGDFQHPIDLSSPALKLITADMRVLRDPNNVISATREAIRLHPGVYRISTFRKRVPTEVARTWGQSQGTLYTDVPADAALERWAVKAIDSRDDAERAEGANALSLFPSGENAELLKKLLSDTALSAIEVERPRSYFVRNAAYQSLMRMGVRVPQPILEK